MKKIFVALFLIILFSGCEYNLGLDGRDSIVIAINGSEDLYFAMSRKFQYDDKVEYSLGIDYNVIIIEGLDNTTIQTDFSYHSFVNDDFDSVYSLSRALASVILSDYPY